MKQMTVDSGSRLAGSTYTNRITCTFEYIMNKERNIFERSFFFAPGQAQGLLFPAELHGGAEQVRKFPGDDRAQVLIGA